MLDYDLIKNIQAPLLLSNAVIQKNSEIQENKMEGNNNSLKYKN